MTIFQTAQIETLPIDENFFNKALLSDLAEEDMLYIYKNAESNNITSRLYLFPVGWFSGLK